VRMSQRSVITPDIAFYERTSIVVSGDAYPCGAHLGLSYLELSVKPNSVPSFPIVAKLDSLEISDVELSVGR
jgi:hypothetical protein